MSKLSAKLLRTSFNIPTVLMLSILPDIDLIFPFLNHRGPTHSIIVFFLIFIPFFLVYRRKAIPYFLALAQHSLVGDVIFGSGIRLLWPLTSQYYGIQISMLSQASIIIEWVTFVISIVIMLRTKDAAKLLQQSYSNLILLVPISTLLSPVLFAFPLAVPIWLIPPHLIYAFLFLASTALGAIKPVRKPAMIWRQKPQNISARDDSAGPLLCAHACNRNLQTQNTASKHGG